MTTGWQALFDRASLLYNRGQYERAVDVATAALEAAEEMAMQTLNPSIPCNVKTVHLLAKINAAAGDDESAEFLFIRAVELAEKSQSSLLADVVTSYADMHFNRRRYNETLPLLRQALALYDRLDADKPMKSATLNNLATTYFHLKRFDAAEALYLQALEFTEKIPGPSYILTNTIRDNLARLYAAHPAA